MLVWIVGRFREEDPRWAWDLMGVFSSEEIALANAEIGWFYATMTLDQLLDETTTVGLPTRIMVVPDV